MRVSVLLPGSTRGELAVVSIPAAALAESADRSGDYGSDALLAWARRIGLFAAPAARAQDAIQYPRTVGMTFQHLRRLVAVVAADVVGYTRLMEAHEEETHRQLMRLR